MAMEQVLNQEYSQLCRHQGKKIVVMGVSFSAQERNIGTWQGELLEEDESLIRKLAPEDKQQACDLLFAAPLSIEQCSYLETVQGRKLDLLDLDPPHKIVADQRKLAEFFFAPSRASYPPRNPSTQPQQERVAQDTEASKAS